MKDEGERSVLPGAKLLGILGISAVLVVSLAILAYGGAQDDPAGHGSGSHTSAAGDGHGGDGNHADGGNHSGPRDPVTWVIDVQDNAFAPSDLAIQINDTVRWVHGGANFHSVTSDDDGATFDSHPDCNPTVPVVDCMENGDEFGSTFEDLGEIQYHCKVHASMTGKVTVLANSDQTPDHHSR